MTDHDDPILAAFDRAVAAAADCTYVMTLFVTGASDRSARAITNAQAICDTHLPGRHELTIVDLLDDVDVVRQNGVLAAPTLVLHDPPPTRQFVGDLSHPGRVLDALGIPVASRGAPSPDVPQPDVPAPDAGG
jgi:circadian clock protein KaiB